MPTAASRLWWLIRPPCAGAELSQPPTTALRAGGGGFVGGPACRPRRTAAARQSWPRSSPAWAPAPQCAAGGAHTLQGMRKKCRTAGPPPPPCPLRGARGRVPLAAFSPARLIPTATPLLGPCSGAGLRRTAGSLFGRPCHLRPSPYPTQFTPRRWGARSIGTPGRGAARLGLVPCRAPFPAHFLPGVPIAPYRGLL